MIVVCYNKKIDRMFIIFLVIFLGYEFSILKYIVIDECKIYFMVNVFDLLYRFYCFILINILYRFIYYD